MDTTWCIDQYRNPYDSKEVWELKRSFMEKYQKTIPETELVSLTQAMVNLEVFQCQYPAELTYRIKTMAAEMLSQFRLQQSHSLTIPDPLIPDEAKTIPVPDSQHLQMDTTTVSNSDDDEDLEELNSSSEVDDPFRNKFGRVLLIDRSLRNNPSSVFQASIETLNVPQETKTHQTEDGAWKHELYLNGLFVASGTDARKSHAKILAEKNAVDVLSKMYFTLKRKPQDECTQDVEIITKAHLKSKSLRDFRENKLGQTNVGFRLLKSMGWSGEGGLGSRSGSTNPIAVPAPSGRCGLGCKNSGRYLRNILEGYSTSAKPSRLRFDQSFGVNDRKIIRSTADRLKLKVTQIKDAGICLEVSRKEVQKAFDIARRLLDGESLNYELVPPKGGN